MREILFKAKRTDNGEWVEGYYCKINETTYCVEEDYKRLLVPTHHYILVETMTDWGLPNRFLQFEIDLDTICQYTGLTDKNGEMIWENDIVKNKKRTEGFDWYKVVWRKDFADFGVEPIKPKFEAKYPMGLSDELTIYGRDYEVVGNVFDNPELLEVN